jgi:hypothetical protein
LRFLQGREALYRTLEDLAAFGEKRVGTDAGFAAGEYVAERMRAAGLQEVRFDSFRFPHHQVHRASLVVRTGGAPVGVGFEVLEGSAGGRLCGPLTFVGFADQPDMLVKRDLRGRIALVERNPLLHRSTQYLNVAQAGAAAMISISAAPGNLRQVGSVRRSWEAAGPIPALSVGAVDGAAIKAALADDRRVEVDLDVEVEVLRGLGRNVLGVVPGLHPAQIVIGAHYDSWFAGSTDNGAGVAAMLALAERRARRSPPRYTLVFVGWDGEEIALYGGYHHARRMLDAEHPTLAVIGFETPAAHGAQAYGLARSNQEPLDHAIHHVGLHELFALNAPMELVPELFGGVIPTDVQGHYRGGTPTICTAGDSPYYHTAEDTPDKVDVARLAETVDGFDRAIEELLAEAPERFQRQDPALWRLTVELQTIMDGLVVDVHVRDGAGVVQSLAAVEAVLFQDDFFEVAARRALTDANGRATLVLPRPDEPGMFLHVTAGQRYPLVERLMRLDVTSIK